MVDNVDTGTTIALIGLVGVVVGAIVGIAGSYITITLQIKKK